jgi:hypothetical protein
VALRPSKFKLDEDVSVAGKSVRVAGRVQFEGADAQLTIRYLLAEPSGATQILEESGGKFVLLRPFPPAAAPQAAGNTVTVMGEKYTLGAVRKLKVLGTEGRAPVAGPAAPLLLSGLFAGKMGALVREMAPGAGTQAFFSVKPVSPQEVLNGEQLAAIQEAERLAAEQRAQLEADEEEGDSGSPVQKIVTWVATILVVAGLAYACTGSEDESSGSARTSFSWGGSGGK